MDKLQFLDRLRKALDRLPESEAEKSISFYAEMIDDRIEEGESEQEAVAGMGDPAAIAATIVEELPAVPKAIVKSKTKSKTLNWVLLIVGSPLWITLAMAAFMVIFAVYITIWSLVVTVWALAVGLLAGLPLGIFVFFVCLASGEPWVGMWELGAGLLLSGVGVFCLYGAIKASASLMDVSKRYMAKVRSWFKKKETADEF